ncbi:MAG: cell division topological specificity factor MinE [Armatimonadetes bacterium CG07_land_8_20_14_0_80_40_9]|nr:MAG: cell division topological specificity factor MinE [Armatimonadetes bacterium CG07_land_8_20_14_0_80_40_9]
MPGKISSLVSSLNKLFRKEGEVGSKERAKERLRLVLISDRSNISPHLLETLKEDLIAVISKYVEIDTSSLEVYLERDEKATALTASMPVKKIKRTKGLRSRTEVRSGK